MPTAEIRDLLASLAADSKNTVVIVSGRDHQTLQDWLGDLPLYFIAEHGVAYRAPSEDWQVTEGLSTAWQKPVGALMNRAVAAVPGSFLESKSNSLAWHYRTAQADVASEGLRELQNSFVGLAEQHDLRVLDGNKVVEVQPRGIDKGASVDSWFDVGSYDFVLAMGDDVTDEDLFRALPSAAFTIKVGSGQTEASERLPDPVAVRTLLGKLIQ